MGNLAVFCGYVACGFIALLAITILIFIWTNRIDFSTLLTEANGQASMSRLQLLIFTFVISESLLILVASSPKGLPEIPPGVLTLLGISASTYAVGKGISYSRDEGVTSPSERGEKRETLTKLAPEAQTAAVKEGNSGL